MSPKKWLSVWITVLVVLALAAPALAQEGSGVTVEARQRVNVRSGPGTIFGIIGQLNAGDVVNATGRDGPGNDWLQIDFNGQAGWVAYFTVNVNGDPNTLPIVAADTTAAQQPAAAEPPAAGAETTVQATTDFFVTANARVNVRSGPGTLYTVIGQLAAGSSADITGRDSAENDWLRIDFGGQEGWVAFSVVDVTGDPNTAEIVGPGETAAFIETAAQQNAQARLNVVYRTRMNVNLRATPDLNAQVLTVIPANTDVQPNARTVQSNWLRVTYNGQTGWIVTGMAARLSGDLRTVPVATQ